MLSCSAGKASKQSALSHSCQSVSPLWNPRALVESLAKPKLETFHDDLGGQLPHTLDLTRSLTPNTKAAKKFLSKQSSKSNNLGRKSQVLKLPKEISNHSSSSLWNVWTPYKLSTRRHSIRQNCCFFLLASCCRGRCSNSTPCTTLWVSPRKMPPATNPVQIAQRWQSEPWGSRGPFSLRDIGTWHVRFQKGYVMAWSPSLSLKIILSATLRSLKIQAPEKMSERPWELVCSILFPEKKWFGNSNSSKVLFAGPWHWAVVNPVDRISISEVMIQQRWSKWGAFSRFWTALRGLVNSKLAQSVFETDQLQSLVSGFKAPQAARSLVKACSICDGFLGLRWSCLQLQTSCQHCDVAKLVTAKVDKVREISSKSNECGLHLSLSFWDHKDTWNKCRVFGGTLGIGSVVLCFCKAARQPETVYFYNCLKFLCFRCRKMIPSTT